MGFLFTVKGGLGQVYVSPNGNDANAGSEAAPFATLNAALRQVREVRRLQADAMHSAIKIIVKGGTYFLYEPVFIRSEDGGTVESPTIIEAAPNEKPVFSGGIPIALWKKLAVTNPKLSGVAKGKIWIADVPLANGQLFNFRQLWINNQKAIRAKSANGNSMHRILNWNKKNETAIIPTLNFKNLQSTVGMEMFIHQWWEIANLRIRKTIITKDSTVLFFHQPESKIQNEHPWPAPWLSKETGNSAFYLTNALQFLDEPGEWYLDVANRKLYYWPRPDENLATAKVIVPYLETIFKIEGTAETPVKNLLIKNIAFEHTGWLRPSLQGHVPHQTGMYMTDAYKLRPPGTPEKRGLDNQAWIGRPAAAVTVNFADKINIENCTFQHLASTALDLERGVKNSFVQGNLFKDIGGTALLAGVFSDEGQEVHLPYKPTDSRVVSENIKIENNFITNATNEDWGTVGIGAGYVRNVTIAHNEIENVSYSGISVGWGWTPQQNVMRNNKIIANKIHHYGKHNYDCAGIYTLSAQPGTLISENYIDSIYKAPYAHLPTHWFYLYTDEGSSGITVKNNWTPSQKYLQNNNGPGNIWENNGPDVDLSVKQKSGLQPENRTLTTNGTAKNIGIPINEERSELIELIVKSGKTLDVKKLKQLLHDNGMDSGSVYQWKDHYVIYSKVKDVGVMQGRIQNNFPEVVVRVYHDMFYEFSKQKHCPNKTIAAQWKHIILTANLVKDEMKQQEYLDYHATQFKNWPEVSNGFCNANFQQLVMFKNGRQLMLVISIPRGSSLDDLNPKTTENNPRVDEWNKLMGPYQEGIEGTKPGEKWVFLEKR
ncbi:MAG: L-rhamnose mutarotase [Niabella sp.]